MILYENHTSQTFNWYWFAKFRTKHSLDKQHQMHPYKVYTNLLIIPRWIIGSTNSLYNMCYVCIFASDKTKICAQTLARQGMHSCL